MFASVKQSVYRRETECFTTWNRVFQTPMKQKNKEQQEHSTGDFYKGPI